MNQTEFYSLWESTINAVEPANLDAKIEAAKTIAIASGKTFWLIECWPRYGEFAGKFWGYNGTTTYHRGWKAKVAPDGAASYPS